MDLPSSNQLTNGSTVPAPCDESAPVVQSANLATIGTPFGASPSTTASTSSGAQIFSFGTGVASTNGSTNPFGPGPAIGFGCGGMGMSIGTSTKKESRELTTWSTPAEAGEWDKIREMLLELEDGVEPRSREFGGNKRGVSFMAMLARSGRSDLLRLALSKGGNPEEMWEATDVNGRYLFVIT